MSAAPRPLAAVVMAAGEGTRMASRLPKVLHEVAGRSMVARVIEVVCDLGPEYLLVVVGNGAVEVTKEVASTLAEKMDFAAVLQPARRGTGDAVRLALGALDGTLTESLTDLDVIVLSGDTPLLCGQTLRALMAEHRESGAAVTLVSAVVDDATGYGRVIRGADGEVVRIVEHSDATEEERRVTEINAAVYVFRAAPLGEALKTLQPNNAKGEYYLTDTIAWFIGRGLRVRAVVAKDADEVAGVNDLQQLREAERTLLRREGAAT